jgi:hypothetical protein
MATAAIGYATAQVDNRLPKVNASLLILAKQVQRQAQCSLAPDAGETRQLAHRIFEQC